MTAPRAWLLNLDADDELAHPDRRRDPFAAMEARPHLAAALIDLVQADVVLAPGTRAPPGATGRAFSPTPQALEALTRAGARPGPAPDLAVLRRVADRRFGLALGEGHTGGALVLDRRERMPEVARAIPGARVFKRIFGYAGRGRHLAPLGPSTDAELAFVERALREDGAVVVEPWLDRTLDLGIHGFLDRSGALTLGAPTVQDTSRGGTWRASRIARHGEIVPEEAQALEDQARLAAAGLRDAGYFGPFGVDAFRWERSGQQSGERGFVARCEINPRYTMGWAIGMGGRRPDLDP